MDYIKIFILSFINSTENHLFSLGIFLNVDDHGKRDCVFNGR